MSDSFTAPQKQDAPTIGHSGAEAIRHALAMWDAGYCPSVGLHDAELLLQERDALVKALHSAIGHMLNAEIDLETGTKKATTLATLKGGISAARDALKLGGQS